MAAPLGIRSAARNWQLPGSNNGTSWTPVDTQTFSARQQRRVFTVASPASYRAYRLNITQNNGVSELQLF